MRIAILGTWDSQFRAENDWERAFQSHGLDVLRAHGPALSWRQVRAVAQQSDVLMWVTTGKWQTTPNLGRQVSEYVRTVGWRPDRYHGRGIGAWQRDNLWQCDRVFTTDGWQGNDWGDIPHRFMEQAVSEKWVARKGRRRNAFAVDVAFVGKVDNYPERAWQPHRVELAGRLREMCDRNGWSYLNPGGIHRQIPRGPRMSDFYRTARVTIGDSMNFWGPQDCYWSNRLPEALGRGGVVVWPENEPVRERTGDWLPMFRWNDWGGLEATIAGLLASPDDNADLRAQGKEWAAGNTYERRVPELLDGWL